MTAAKKKTTTKKAPTKAPAKTAPATTAPRFKEGDRIIPRTDKTFIPSRVLRVSHDDGQILQAAPEGGGMVYRFDAAARAKWDFRLVTPADKATWYRAVFALTETDYPMVLGWTNGERWNGWAKPYFSRTEGVRFVSDASVKRDAESGFGKFTFIADDAEFEVDYGIEQDPEGPFRILPESISEIPNHEDGDPDEICPVYDFSLGMVWEEVTRAMAMRMGQRAFEEWCGLMGEKPFPLLKAGDRVRFKAGASRAMHAPVYELELGGLTGTVTETLTGVDIRLDQHFVELDAWDNEISYSYGDDDDEIVALQQEIERL